MSKGKLIVIDGTDGTGKKTQTEILLKRLLSEGIKAYSLDFPQYENNIAGKLLHEALKEDKHGDFLAISPKIASVIYAFDRMESSPTIRGWIDDGAIVILDRYVSSNQIHQGGKIADPIKRREFINWLDELEFTGSKLPRPDIVLYLDVPVEVSLQLIQKRAEITGLKPDQSESSGDHLRESQERTLSVINEYPNWKRVDCSDGDQIKSRESIHESIYQIVKEYLV